MTQQTTLLRKLWQEQTEQGYRFRATIKSESYNRDEARSFWMLVNPTLLRERTVLASHMWVQQDQSLAYPPSVGAIISFEAEITPYRRKNGTSGFGLHHVHNVRIEAEMDAELTDYAMSEEEMRDELELEAELAALPAIVWDNAGAEQNIAAAAQQRSARLTQHIEFNARIASLAQRQEKVTTQFLQAWQQAQTVAADLAKLAAEIDGDPNLTEEREALQQLANLQRDLATTYWHWQPAQSPEDSLSIASMVIEPPAAPRTTTVPTSSAATVPPTTSGEAVIAPTILAPLVPPVQQLAGRPDVATVFESPIAVEEEPEIDLMQMIKSALPTHDAPPASPPTPRRAPQRQVVSPLNHDAHAAIDRHNLADPLAPNTAATHSETAHPEPPPHSAHTRATQPTAKKMRDQRALHDAIVEQVWKLVQRLQPTPPHTAPYTLAQIKDGRLRETDHLKLIGLKAILASLALDEERPTRKELARYLGYDLPKAWSLSKLSEERLPQADEKVQVEILREIKKFIRTQPG